MPLTPPATPAELVNDHLIGLEGYPPEKIRSILNHARDIREKTKAGELATDELSHWTIALLFFEPSTRTKMSFNLAAKQMGAGVITFTPTGSSLSKGESLKDTAQTVEAMGVDVIVLRHGSSGAPQSLISYTDAHIVNAGDGAHEHPTQALLDLLTIADLTDEPFEGLEVGLMGDIAHSRVARSSIFGLNALGANVTVCGPPTMMPFPIEALGVRFEQNVEPLMERCDVVMALRIQRERQDNKRMPGQSEYHRKFGLTLDHLERHPEVHILHPGPVNRGIELAPDVVDHSRSRILDQVRNAVYIRKAVLRELAQSTS